MRSPVDCGRLVDVTLNIGMAGDEQAKVTQLVANASMAAVDAGRKGLRWEFFSNANSDETNWHLSLLSELDAAMTSGQVWNAYQPKLDIATGRVIGAETLVRWLHPERGPIAPDNFIPLVEQHDRASDLTLHVLSRALQDAAQWQAAGVPIGVAVNVSATLLGDKTFVEQVRQILDGSTIPTDQVTMEVTESAAMDNPDRAIAALESWRALGVNISIDDYGTGQSSLGYLQKLPATELKIDKSFIRDINSEERNAIMVRSTIALAHELGIKVVAEGIEDAACLKTLAEMGCDTGQGYHIGRPMSASNLQVFLGGFERAAA
jgi:EAL domain-containing protein (putative c-di-GMP-specific phosphodiesterase class I)